MTEQMRDSLKAFTVGVAKHWWFWAVTVLSTITTFTGLYYPRSLLERSILNLAPAFGVTIFMAAFFIAAYLTYKELYDKLRTYDPVIGEQLHLLYQRGNALHSSDVTGAVRWQNDVVVFLRKWIPGEVRMFQTVGDRLGKQAETNSPFGMIDVLQAKLPAQVDKLRLIMGRYEERQS